MNLFFYTTVRSAASDDFIQRLRDTEALPPLTILPVGGRFHGEPRSQIRNGDVMLLYAATHQEIHELLTLHDSFEELKTIIILGDYSATTVAISHMLRPRYIAPAASDTRHLKQVLAKMLPHDQRGPQMDTTKA